MKKLLLLFISLMQFEITISSDTEPIEIAHYCECFQTRSFNDVWSVCKSLYGYVKEHLPYGSTMIEFGSGWASGEFSKHYKVYSVEHNAKWLNKYDTHYIYAPIVNGWYDTNVLKRELPENYDFILVDGPPGEIGRGKFVNNIHLFKKDVLIIFDDIHREAEYKLMVEVAQLLKRKFKVHACGTKKFGVLLLKEEKKI